MNFLEDNRKKLKDAPFGLYAVVPSPSGDFAHLSDTSRLSSFEKEIVQSGVLYCLRQKGDTEGNEEVNPLQPYFLVYIRNDGSVRFNYTNAKQILEIYRLLCSGVRKPYEVLCDLFNAETKQGEDMTQYSDLLKKAFAEISRVFKKRVNNQLTSNRGALLMPKSKQVDDMSDFELVTWLIIK